jgi:hypothetical protein
MPLAMDGGARWRAAAAVAAGRWWAVLAPVGGSAGAGRGCGVARRRPGAAPPRMYDVLVLGGGGGAVPRAAGVVEHWAGRGRAAGWLAGWQLRTSSSNTTSGSRRGVSGGCRRHPQGLAGVPCVGAQGQQLMHTKHTHTLRSVHGLHSSAACTGGCAPARLCARPEARCVLRTRAHTS